MKHMKSSLFTHTSTRPKVMECYNTTPSTFCIECPRTCEYPRSLLLPQIYTRPQSTWGEELGKIWHIREVLEEVVGGERVGCEGVEEGEGGGELQGEPEEEKGEGGITNLELHVHIFKCFVYHTHYLDCNTILHVAPSLDTACCM